MDKRRAELHRSWFETMYKSKRLMQGYFARVLAEMDISATQSHILSVIQENQPISLKSLAARSYMTPGAITQFVDALERKHMITRTQDTKDRRITYINLAPDGKKAVLSVNKARNKILNEALASLNDEELEQMAAIQQKMMKIFEKQMQGIEGKE